MDVQPSKPGGVFGRGEPERPIVPGSRLRSRSENARFPGQPAGARTVGKSLRARGPSQSLRGMSKALSVGVFGLLVSLCATARAQPDPSAPAGAEGAVRRYFDALRRMDDRAVSAVTEGRATVDTRGVIAQIRDEARRNSVGVELKLAELHVVPIVDDTAAHAVALFDLRVIARKWFFSKVARELRGRATFTFASSVDDSPPKITDIKLDLFG